jgi:hypothetical protein
MSDGASTPANVVLAKLPPPEEVRERLGKSKREVALLKQLLKLSEKVAQGTPTEREVVNA